MCVRVCPCVCVYTTCTCGVVAIVLSVYPQCNMHCKVLSFVDSSILFNSWHSTTATKFMQHLPHFFLLSFPLKNLLWVIPDTSTMHTLQQGKVCHNWLDWHSEITSRILQSVGCSRRGGGGVAVQSQNAWDNYSPQRMHIPRHMFLVRS